MSALLHSLAMFVIDFFKSPRRLEAENLFLRHQLGIALRRAPPRLRLRGSDRAVAKAIFDGHGPAFDIASLGQTFKEGRDDVRAPDRSRRIEETDNRV